MSDLTYGSTYIGTIDGSTVLADKKIRSVDNRMFSRFDMNMMYPLTALQSQVAYGAPFYNPKHEWGMKDIQERWATVETIVSGAASPTLVITVSVADLPNVRTGESIEFTTKTATASIARHGYISDVNRTNRQVTILMSNGLNAPALVAGTDRFQIVGLVAGGTSKMPDAKNLEPTMVYNYPVLLRYPTEIDYWQLQQANYFGPQEQESMDEQEKEIKMSWERFLLFGEREMRTVSNGNHTGTLYQFRGHRRWIEETAGADTFDYGTLTTQRNWDDFLMDSDCMKYGSPYKYLFTGSDFYKHLHGFTDSKTRIQIGGGQKVIDGVHMSQYKAPNGKILNIIEHHLLEGDYAGHACIIDPLASELRPYGDNPLFGIHENIQPNDKVSKANEFRMCGTLQVSMAYLNAWITD